MSLDYHDRNTVQTFLHETHYQSNTILSRTLFPFSEESDLIVLIRIKNTFSRVQGNVTISPQIRVPKVSVEFEE